MNGDGSGQRSRLAWRVRMLLLGPVWRRVWEQDGSGRQAACHQRCLDNRRNRSLADVSRLRIERRSRCFGRRATPAGGRSPAWAAGIDDLAGVAAQRRHSEQRPRVSRDNSATARQARCSPPQAGEACAECGLASLCGGTAGWRCRRSKRGACSRPGRILERPSTWTAARLAVSKRLEPRADCPPPTG